MKKTINILQKISILTLLLFLMSCTNSKKKELTEEFEQQRKQAIERLDNLTMDVDKALKDIENNVTVNEERIQGIKKDIMDRKEMLGKTLEKVKNASQEEWSELKSEADATTKSIEGTLGKMKADLEAAANKIKEEADEVKEKLSDSN